MKLILILFLLSACGHTKIYKGDPSKGAIVYGNEMISCKNREFKKFACYVQEEK